MPRRFLGLASFRTRAAIMCSYLMSPLGASFKLRRGYFCQKYLRRLVESPHAVLIQGIENEPRANQSWCTRPSIRASQLRHTWLRVNCATALLEEWHVVGSARAGGQATAAAAAAGAAAAD